jgi:hypothetical protein
MERLGELLLSAKKNITPTVGPCVVCEGTGKLRHDVKKREGTEIITIKAGSSCHCPQGQPAEKPKVATKVKQMYCDGCGRSNYRMAGVYSSDRKIFVCDRCHADRMSGNI